jgi:hypothetical protein
MIDLAVDDQAHMLDFVVVGGVAAFLGQIRQPPSRRKARMIRSPDI